MNKQNVSSVSVASVHPTWFICSEPFYSLQFSWNETELTLSLYQSSQLFKIKAQWSSSLRSTTATRWTLCLNFEDKLLKRKCFYECSVSWWRLAAPMCVRTWYGDNNRNWIITMIRWARCYSLQAASCWPLVWFMWGRWGKKRWSHVYSNFVNIEHIAFPHCTKTSTALPRRNATHAKYEAN